MSYQKAQLMFPQLETVNGVPAEGYTVNSYIWDTSTPLAMYTSSTGSGAATSFSLNSAGITKTAGGTPCDIFLDTTKVYKFIIKDAAGAQFGPTIGPVYGSDAINPDFTITSDQVTHEGPIAAIPYLQTVSDILNGEMISALRFIPASKHADIRAGTNTDDLADYLNDALQNTQSLQIPDGTYWIEQPLQFGLNNTRRVSGHSRAYTKIKSATDDIFYLGNTNDADETIIECLQIISESGGGHCFSPKFGLSKFTLRDCVVQQDNPSKCLWYQDTGYSGGNIFERLQLIAASAGTMTINPWYHNSTEITNGFAFRDIRANYSRNGYQFFRIDSSNASSFNTNGTFENITFELTYGGMIRLGGHRATAIKNVASYDLAGTQTGHGILVGQSAGGLASSACLIRRANRYPSSGALDTNICDIKLESGKALSCTIEDCMTSAAGYVFTVDYGNNVTRHVFPVTGVGASYLNAGNVQYVDPSNGDTLNGAVKFDAGSVAAPSITKDGDTDTGVYFPAANTLALVTAGVERLRVNSSGSVLMGKTSTNTVADKGFEFNQTTGEVFVVGDFASGNALLYCNRKTSDGDLVHFYQDGTKEGSISVSGTTVSYNGGHLARWSQLIDGSDPSDIPKGTVMTNHSAMCEWDNEENEQLNKTSVCNTENDINFAGVFVAASPPDPIRSSYDQEILRESSGPTIDYLLAMTGDFIIRIAPGVIVRRGDLLTSARDGTAKPQEDDIIRSSTIGKVTSDHVSIRYADGSYCVPCVLMAC